MFNKGFLKRLIVKQPYNQYDYKSFNKYDLLVLNKKRVYLGRNKECDLILQDKIISRKHLAFYYKNGYWSIECLNDTNGVFVNGKLLKKNQEKKLEDNFIISFSPMFETPFIYQFTTKDCFSSENSENLITFLNLPKLNKESLIEHKNPKTIKLPENKMIDQNKFSANMDQESIEKFFKKTKFLRSRIKFYESKLLISKNQHKDTRAKLRKINLKLRILTNKYNKLKLMFKNNKVSLSKERTKRKNLQKKLLVLESSNKEKSVEANSPKNSAQENVSQDEKLIVQKYNELFSEDFICCVCHELFIDPVSANCGHSFCKFCIDQWFKRNINKKDCPMCRTKIRAYFKQVVIENIIEKFIKDLDDEFLKIRNRLIQERDKVIEASKYEKNTNHENSNSLRRYSFSNSSPLTDVLQSPLNDLSYFLSQSDVSSNEDDEEDEAEDEVIDFFNEDIDGYETYSEGIDYEEGDFPTYNEAMFEQDD